MELPASFIDYTRALLGDEEYDKLAVAIQQEPPVSIRLNPLKPFVFQLGEDEVPWCASGFYLKERLTFTFDPLFHAGCYYVQEASSMFVEQVLRQHWGEEPAVMLDLCAAPGGKSTHVRSILPENSLLIANEVIRNRSQILAENLAKWGHTGVVVTNNDPSDFTPLKDLFDIILTDVPCSGEGMFRKDPVAVSEWSLENVEVCWRRQRRIISDIWPCLKPGGILIYSTCTYNTKENEENIRWIRDEFGAEVLPLDVAEDWNITGNLLPGEHFPVYRFLPYKTKGEGFFLAVLRKNGEEETSDWAMSSDRYENERVKSKKKRALHASVPALPASCRSWLLHADAFDFVPDGPVWTAVRASFSRQVGLLQEAVKVWQAGVPLATVKGKDYIPLHALAMSVDLNRSAFPIVPVSYDMAVAYLRKEVLVLPPDTPKGYVLLTFQDTPIGFVKNIGGRANNLYPQEWKIRTSYLSTYSLKGDLG